ncbi:MAG: hypothetical protein COU41_00660 [Candidatus Nealsonbacteria bacterium CG10_big_fil_rev_8_21_14_0_10_36_228]|uniref:Uncharacterized protein n=1 Tax=Candidatus Nealsonbacteria bacterium CG10_big_fil_rev_8_21_14_0_10_36_228 TaxID=1974708 RepID=A0A2H0TKD4_9BACT|nr:MAG: hypothetical protein COU41_00660 [Candidatus Nealsonbacteria bacterium CG10_big_fil_rev_8_21_14_0_10_36_228]
MPRLIKRRSRSRRTFDVWRPGKVASRMTKRGVGVRFHPTLETSLSLRLSLATVKIRKRAMLAGTAHFCGRIQL